jgi:hypothetical protein
MAFWGLSAAHQFPLSPPQIGAIWPAIPAKSRVKHFMQDWGKP